MVFGHSVRGERLRAVRLGDPDAARKVLVIGQIHGDEGAGRKVISRIRHRYRDIRGTQLWTVKTVNPDGNRAGTRGNAHGVDLNRNFPYRWSPTARTTLENPGPRPFSEPESRAAARLIRRIKPQVTIWYHQPWGQVLAPCHGPARVQRRYSRISGVPLERCRGQHLRGTATSWQNHNFAGRAFVVELPAGHLSGSAVRRNARAVAAIAKRKGGRAGARSAAKAGGAVSRPPIHHDPIPFGSRRKHETAAYSKRHYGKRAWRLHPRAIVLHFTAGSSYRSARSTFASDAPNMGERPGLCAHFVVGKGGAIHELVRPGVRCRHTIGLNHVALGIEMVQEAGPGSHWADRQILQRKKQSRAAVHLVAWLKRRFGIRIRNIIGHSMANDSPYFKDLEGWRNDHTDWLRRDVRVFRHRVQRVLSR